MPRPGPPTVDLTDARVLKIVERWDTLDENQRAAFYNSLAPHTQEIIRLIVVQRAQQAGEIRRYASPGELEKAIYPDREDPPHLQAISKVWQRIDAGEVVRVIIVVPVRHGKLLALDTPIPTPSGYKTMGDLKEGDELFDENGQVCRVIEKHPIYENVPCYQVIVRSEVGDVEDVIVASDSHPWPVRVGSDGPVCIHTTEEIAKSGSVYSHVSYRTLSAEPCESVPLQCISVDSPSNLYLCGKAMVPTHNTVRSTHIGVPWFIDRNPNKRVVYCTYGQDFASLNGGLARNTVISHPSFFSSQVDPSAYSRQDWRLLSGPLGGMYSTSLDGTITGRGADVLLVDDPVKNRAAAESKAERDSLWEGWESNIVSRLEPGGSVMVIMARWHEDDFGGRLIKAGEENGEPWELIHYPAIAEAEDDIGRKPGEALWPGRYDEEALRVRKRDVGPYAWASLYQGRAGRGAEEPALTT
jgi:hypothetical protein